LTSGTQTTISTTSGTPFLPFVYAATIANSGKVYITGNTNLSPDSLLVGNGGNLAPADGGLGLVGYPAGAPAVSSNGHYAVTGASYDRAPSTMFNGVVTDVVLGGNGTVTEPNFFCPGLPATYSLDQFGDPDVNAAGSIVVSADWGAIFSGVYRMDSAGITRIAFGRATPAINDNGVVAALFRTGVKSLKVGDGAPTDTVLSVGDSFMGSTVTDLGFTHEGLSDGNYLAFSATLADGRQGIYLTAVPEPAAVALGLVGTLIFMRRRGKSRRQTN